MEDTELIRIAIFRFRELTNRMRSLAKEAHSASVQAKFEALSQELERLERGLHDREKAAGLAAAGPDTTVHADDPARRAVLA